MGEALVRHDDIVRGTLERWGGYVFATGGDGFASAFQRARDAVAAAVDVQRGLAQERWLSSVPLRVRVAVHSGEAVERDGDYFGPPVNRAARLLSLASGDQIVCSEVTAGLCGELSGIEFVRLGSASLRDVTDEVPVMGVVADGVAHGTFVRDMTAVGLPRSATGFVGRVHDLQRLDTLLRECRLLTLMGTGGVGKTRLAVELAWRAVDEFRDGCWLIELAPVTEPDGVEQVVATTLSVRMRAGQPVADAIIENLSGRECLVVLDNCEHLLDATAELVDGIERNCPKVTILATSREPLGLSAERVWRVRSLDVGSEGIALFEDRLRRVDESSSGTVDDRETIVAICERLDGIPLAIELAAARAATLGVADLLRRLDDPFRVLRGSGRGRVERHQTLRAAVTWSYDLLDADEQSAFEQCGVFGGTFDLDAAEGVLRLNERDVLDVLVSLVDKSLLVVEPAVTGMRYRLLETLRQYAEERLAARGTVDEVRDRHLDYIVGLATAERTRLEGPAELEAIRRTDVEWDNIRAAVTWALATRDLTRADIILDKTETYAISRYRREHADWNAALIASTDAGLVAARGRQAVWAYYTDEPTAAIALAREALQRADAPTAPDTKFAWFALHFGLYVTGQLEEAAFAADAGVAASHDDPGRLARALVCSAQVAIGHRDRDELADIIERMREPVSAAGTRIARSCLAGEEGMLRYLDGDFAGAIKLLDEAIALGDEIGALTIANSWATALAMVLAELDHVPDARQTYARLIHQCRDDHDATNQWVILEALALHLAHNNRLEAAATLFGGLATQGRLNADFTSERDAALSAISDQHDGPRWLDTGRHLTLDELVEFALAQVEK
jgi:predicted ATPase